MDVPDYFYQVFKLVLAFEEETLATISGDYIPQEADAESDAAVDEGANETSDENEAESASLPNVYFAPWRATAARFSDRSQGIDSTPNDRPQPMPNRAA